VTPLDILSPVSAHKRPGYGSEGLGVRPAAVTSFINGFVLASEPPSPCKIGPGPSADFYRMFLGYLFYGAYFLCFVVVRLLLHLVFASNGLLSMVKLASMYGDCVER